MADNFFKVKKGLNLGEQASNPSNASQGDMYTNSTTKKVMVYLDNAWHEVVSHDGSHVLTNKTLSTNNVVFSEAGNSDVATAKQIKLSAATATAGTNTALNFYQSTTRSIDFPDASGKVVLDSDNITLTNKTISAANNSIITAASGNLSSTTLNAALSELQTDIDTRATQVALTNHTSASSGVHGVTGSVVGTVDTQTLQNKTLANPNTKFVDSSDISKAIKFSSSAASSNTTTLISTVAQTDITLTLPNGNTTIVGRDTTDTLSNKTLAPDTTTFKDVSANKGFKFDVSQNAAGVLPSIRTNFQTASTLDLPSISLSDTLVSRNSTDVLTNKTLSAASNTILGLTNSSISNSAAIVDTKLDTISTAGKVANSATTATSANTAGAIVARGASGEFSAGAITATDLTLSGNLTVNGTTTTVNTTDLNVKDKNITINNGGSDASSEGAGITVDRVGTDGSLIYKNASATKFAAGALGSEVDLVGTTSSQTLSNKNMVAGSTYFVNATDETKAVRFTVTGSAGTTTYITASPTLDRNVVLPDESGIVVLDTSTATLSNKKFSDAVTLAEIATPSTPPSGFGRIYFKNDNKLYMLNDLGVEQEVGAGAGGGTGGVSNAAYAFTNGVGTPVNCSVSVVGGKTTLTLAFGYSVAVSPGLPYGSLDVYLNGQLIPRFINATLTPDASYTESSTTTITLDRDYSSQNLSVEVLQRSQIIDTSTQNTTDIDVLKRRSAGLKNYLSYYVASTASGTPNYGNGDFELGNTTGWSLFNTTVNATTKFPTGTITSGASSLNALSVSSSGQLGASYSLSVASPGAITQGHGFISDSFYIDSEDQAKVLSFKFAYKVVSGKDNANFSGTSSNTLAVYIYDVDAGAWIQPAGVYNLVQNSGAGLASGTFQTSSSGTRYRIAVVAINASSGALSMLFDDFYVGPQIVQYGAPVTDPVPYTPTFSNFGTVSAVNFQYWRVGKFLYVEGTFTAGTVAASTAVLTLPSGFAIDGSSLVGPVISSSNRPIEGRWYKNSSTANANKSGVLLLNAFSGDNPTSVVFSVDSYVSAISPHSPRNATDLFSSSDIIYIQLRVPVLGWSSSVQMSSDTDTRVVLAKAKTAGAPTGTIASSFGSATNMIFANAEIDTHGTYSTSTGIYTVPVSGYYRVTAHTAIGGTEAVQDYVAIAFAKNGVQNQYALNRVWATAATSTFVTGSNVFQCNAGDSLSIRAVSNIATATFQSDADAHWVVFERISGPSAIAASETVAARYTSSSGQSFTTGTETVVNYATKDYDTHNAVTTGANWKFTAPVSGKYRITAGIMWSGSNSGVSNLKILKNGNALAVSHLAYYSVSNQTQLKGSETLHLDAGEYISISAAQLSGLDRALVTSNYNSVCIERVGN